MKQRRLVARPARRQGAVRVSAASGEALVVGSSGQTAARVVVNLLRAGFKVTAGVDTDIEESKEVIKFAKQLEILNAGEAGSLKLAEFNPLDADSIATALKRGSRVVLVVGDQAGSRRPDLRIYDAVLDALLENSGRIGQLVVVTPLGGAGGGTSFFGGGRGGSPRLSSLEQRVVDSGVPYLLIRAAPSDRVTDRYGEEANVVVKGLGQLPSGLAASRAQVASAVAAAMSKARSDAIIEVGASPAAPYVDVASQVADVLAGVQQVAQEEEEEAPAPSPTKKPGFFTIGGSKKKAQPVEEVEEEEEEAPALTKKPAFALFGGGATRKVVRQPAPAVEEEEEEEEAPPVPKPARKGGFSFGTLRINKQQKAAAAEVEEDEEAAPAPTKAFRFSTSSAGSSRTEQQPAAQEAPVASQRRVIRGRNPVPAEPEKPAPRAVSARQEAQKQGSSKNSGGFLSFLGVSNETIYADEQ